MLPKLIARFLLENPKVEISVVGGNTQTILEALVDHRVQLCLIEGPAMRRDVQVEPFMEDHMVCAEACHSILASEWLSVRNGCSTAKPKAMPPSSAMARDTTPLAARSRPRRKRVLLFIADSLLIPTFRCTGGLGPSRNNDEPYAVRYSEMDSAVTFAYVSPMLGGVKRPIETLSASTLRREISHRNTARAAGWAAEMSYSAVPNIVYGETDAGEHGNFLPASYRRILRQAGWKARLSKVYTGSRFIPRKADRTRYELECANSSDALLMNIFCYPGVLRRPALCSLLGIDSGLSPAFGVRPGVPLKNGRTDRSEMDLKLGTLFVEAKLTEGDFQTARFDLVHRYRDFETVFDVERLPTSKERFRSCQLIRGALAAHAHAVSFAIFCDQRRQDLIEDCFETISAVTSAELRCRISVVSWQELASTLPPKVRTFLTEKYGISEASTADGW